jgi:hypothetical protein
MVLKSRKFWATVIGVGSVLALHLTGNGLPLDVVVDALKWLVGVFVAATAIEDGLKGGNVDKLADTLVTTMERRAIQRGGPEMRSRN